MLRINEYVKAKTVQEAYDLLQKNRKNRIIGGMMWLRLQDSQVPVGVDLSECGLDKIEESEDEVRIGAMVTLRGLETSPVLAGLYGGIVCECVRDIVGVQFRNLATVGGSVFGRFGFSDLLTALLCLPVEVELHGAGRMPLAEFVNRPRERDVLTAVIVKKGAGEARYKSERRSATDFPVLAAAVARVGGEWRIAVGARPAKAKLLTLPESAGPEEAKAAVKKEFEFGGNLRGSAEYRLLLAQTLVQRGMREITEGGK